MHSTTDAVHTRVRSRYNRGAPTDEERRYHNLTHYRDYPYKDWCNHCVRGRGREDRHHQQKEIEQQGAPRVQLDYSLL
eukprot:1568550-Amphidinium_carterae.4